LDILFLLFSNIYEDMILVELNGGIGNQMFQYAAAKSLALHHDTILKLDITPASNKTMPDELKQRPFDLDNFNLPDSIANLAEVESLSPKSSLGKFTEKAKPNYKRKIYREPFFHYDNNFYHAGPDVYLKGLWQSEKYFYRFSKEIRSIFCFRIETIQHLTDIATNFKQENSVSIHIRRGDYLANISLNVLGLLPIAYYHKAIQLIKTKIDNPSFYFFSDDISWVKENLDVPNGTYLSNKVTKNHLEDLYLMSRCKHNIIANSSFSWWGAWLNNNPGKIVIAPEKWFNNGPRDTQDLIPGGWLKI
jgi:hypothetical protein